MSIDTSRRDRTRLTMEPGDVFAATVRDMGGTEHHLHMIVWDPDHDGEGMAWWSRRTPARVRMGSRRARAVPSSPWWAVRWWLAWVWGGAGSVHVVRHSP